MNEDLSPSGDRVDEPDASLSQFKTLPRRRAGSLPEATEEWRLTDFRYINPPGVFDPSAIYTHIVVPPPGRPVFLAGQWGGDENGELVGGGFSAQVEQAFRNVETHLAAVGLTPGHVTKLVHYVVELEQVKRTALHAIAKTRWPVDKPAATLLGVSRLAREGMLYEVDAHAIIPD